MITQIRISNFKAIQDSGWIKIQPFAVFIGNNGSGKSSVLEALELVQNIVLYGLDVAFEKWGGLESVRNNKAKLDEPQEVGSSGFKVNFQPISIEFKAILEGNSYDYKLELNSSFNNDLNIVQSESILYNSDFYLFFSKVETADGKGAIAAKVPGQLNEEGKLNLLTVTPSEEHLSVYSYLQKNVFGDVYWSSELHFFHEFLSSWQFINLNSHIMGYQFQLNRTKKNIHLSSSGSNIAEFVLEYFKNPEALNSLVAKMEFVLPYLSDIKVQEIKDFNTRIHLELKEKEQETSIPSWLFSSGTLRVLALLSIFTLDNKPSAIFIEEIENGLDPRTIGLLVEEIDNEFRKKKTQIFITTHSPYLLDLLPLDSIVVAEKDKEGCTFRIPKDDESLRLWKEKFSPGKLYTMGKLTK